MEGTFQRCISLTARRVCLSDSVFLLDGLRYIPHRVRYMSERVLRQFGYIQTIPSHPHKNANPKVTKKVNN